ncbi:MAG: glycosyltransferase [Nannocystaceae bacterium]
MRPRIGTWGFGPHPWMSVERTRSFYARALASDFELVDLDAAAAGALGPQVDAILSFHSSRWTAGPRPSDAPVVLAMHGGPVVDYPRLRDRLTHLRTDDTLLVNCSSDEDIVRDLCDGPGPRVVRLPLPVDTEVMAPYHRGDCRQELQLPECDHVVGFVCRLVPQKNLHQFLRAFARIRDRMHPRRVVALVVGSFHTSYPILDYGCAQYRAHIAGLVESLGLADDLVCFPASLDDEDLAMAFSAMDVLLHPTSAVDENFGYVPVEAMACGVPVVGSAYGGLKDTIIAGQTGALMPTWATRSGIRIDLEAGIAAVLDLLRDPAEHERMSTAALQHATTQYSETTCGQVLRQAFHETIAGHRQGRGAAIVTTAAPATTDPATTAPATTAPTTTASGSDLLPPTLPPWDDFLEPARRYASGPPPRITEQTRLQWATPLSRDTEGRLRLHDPAWPAALPAALQDDPWVERCATPVRAGTLARPGTPRWTRLQALVDDGLLVATVGAAQQGVAA